MAASILAILAGLIPLVASIIEAVQVRRNDAKDLAARLAQLELKDTQDAMAAVDRELERLSPDAPKQPILLSSDDHL